MPNRGRRGQGPRTRPEVGLELISSLLQGTGDVARVEDAARELCGALRQRLGVSRSFLIVPLADGSLSAIGEGSQFALAADPRAFDELGNQPPILRLADLTGSPDPAARAAAALLSELEVEIALLLQEEQSLIGLLVFGEPALDPVELDSFCRLLRASATMMMLTAHLRAHSAGLHDLTRSMDLATAVQQSLMPETELIQRPAFEVRGIFVPAAECGGDFWTWRELDSQRCLVVIADATGHGAAPALLSAVAKGTVDACWQLMGAALAPGTLLTALNTAVHRAGKTRYMMSAFAAVLDAERGELRYANAAQNFPFFIGGPKSAEPQSIKLLVAPGDTLGAKPATHYQTHVRPMCPGDKLLMYTDGLVDAVGPVAGRFGERRVRTAVAELASERATILPDLIMARLERYTAGEEPLDDVTLVAAELGTATTNEGSTPPS